MDEKQALEQFKETCDILRPFENRAKYAESATNCIAKAEEQFSYKASKKQKLTPQEESDAIVSGLLTRLALHVSDYDEAAIADAMDKFFKTINAYRSLGQPDCYYGILVYKVEIPS